MERRTSYGHYQATTCGAAGILRVGCVVTIAAAVAAAEAPAPLGAPSVYVDRVTPESAFADFSLPDRPAEEGVRVAAREPLKWRPAMPAGEPSETGTGEVAPQPGEATEPTASKGPELKSLAPAEADRLKLETPAESEAAAADDDDDPKPVAKEPSTAAKDDGPETNLELAKPRVAEAKEPAAPLSRSLKNLRSRLRTVLSFYYRKPMNTVQNTPWEIMHGMLAYELHSRVRDGGPQGRPMTAIGHLCFNRPSKRQRMIRVTEEGELDVAVGVGLQGHRGQLLAMLAQCNVSPDYPVRVAGEELSIRDLIVAEQRTCYPQTELTFKLIGLGHYLASDAEWKNDRGEAWDIPRLIREERNQPIRGAACGGTHRLAGLSLAYRRREARGEPIDGEYLEAARFVSQYQTYAFKLQNSDGSLSTEWFRGRGAEEDIERRIRTTGHLMEWLAYSLPDDQLRSPKTIRAVNYLTNLLAHNADFEWHLGSLGHALHALVVYDKRAFQPLDEVSNIAVKDAVDPMAGRYRGYAIYRGVMRNSPKQPSGFFGLFGSTNASRPGSTRR